MLRSIQSSTYTLAEGPTVRLQTQKGYDLMGTVKEICPEPRSYLVQSEGVFTDGTGHIPAVNEPVPSQQVLDDFTDDPDDVLWSEDGNACLNDGHVTADCEQFCDQQCVSMPVGLVPMVQSPVRPVEKSRNLCR